MPLRFFFYQFPLFLKCSPKAVPEFRIVRLHFLKKTAYIRTFRLVFVWTFFSLGNVLHDELPFIKVGFVFLAKGTYDANGEFTHL